jgi:hypothetical protein
MEVKIYLSTKSKKHVFDIKMIDENTFLVYKFNDRNMINLALNLPFTNLEDAIFAFVDEILQDSLFDIWTEMETLSFNAKTGKFQQRFFNPVVNRKTQLYDNLTSILLHDEDVVHLDRTFGLSRVLTTIDDAFKQL